MRDLSLREEVLIIYQTSFSTTKNGYLSPLLLSLKNFNGNDKNKYCRHNVTELPNLKNKLTKGSNVVEGVYYNNLEKKYVIQITLKMKRKCLGKFEMMLTACEVFYEWQQANEVIDKTYQGPREYLFTHNPEYFNKEKYCVCTESVQRQKI